MDNLQSFLLGSAAAAALTAVTGNTNMQRARVAALKENLSTSPYPPPTANEMNVGILALEAYFPSTFIEQEELEVHNGIPKGKYTIGLGQTAMSITGDREDVNSIALTVTNSLLKKYSINPSQIGRLDVGTETLIDKSKSTKTVLMDLLGPNLDIEGCTNVNACYGGTAAILNAFNHVSSPFWDGRYALVVACDIAAYARGPARPTSGVGAVALLVGRDAPIVFDGVKATHSVNKWDFYKPDHRVEYPVVDGALSQECYYEAISKCYSAFADRAEGQEWGEGRTGPFQADSPDYWVFHAPYNKLVEKSFARLYLVDAIRRYEESGVVDVRDRDLEPWIKGGKETMGDRELDKVLKGKSGGVFKSKLEASNEVSKRVGNTYAASIMMGICSLVDKEGGERGGLKPGATVGIFSYGSGAIATMYGLRVRATGGEFTVGRMAGKLNLRERIGRREKVGAEELDMALDCRARMHTKGNDYSPAYPVDRLFPGTYYLVNIDDKFRRFYDVYEGPGAKGGKLCPPVVVREAEEEKKKNVEEVRVMAEKMEIVPKTKPTPPVVTGVGVGLPGQDNPFEDDNLSKLLRGDNLIKPISGSLRAALLEKNVVRVKKGRDGTATRIKIEEEEQTLKLAAQLGKFTLEKYGVGKSLSMTMDAAASVAVASGLEAMKDAGLLQKGSWELEDKYRESTGVIYITSFPGLDATVEEVMRFLQSKTVAASSAERLVEALRAKFLRTSVTRELSDEDESGFARLLQRAKEEREDSVVEDSAYEYDRKFLFKVLCLGNSQLAQIAKCMGPNCQINTACSGTTTGLAIASDWIAAGRCERVVVVAGDSASSETLLPFIGNGFIALGAACTKGNVDDAAMPFDKRRSGMILGAGGVGIVLERPDTKRTPLAKLLHTQFSNSAYHGAAMNKGHIASELRRFLKDVERLYGITKEEIAHHGVYYSHETSTHSSPTSSCSFNEISALREVFGDELLKKLMITSTKGFTGHAMGCSFEDAAAIVGLQRQVVPPVKNHKVKDDTLGDLRLSGGGRFSHRFALRLGAGFGSQVAWAIYLK